MGRLEPDSVPQMRAVERARVDIQAGRLWKARDRLHGAFVSSPADPTVLGLLGDVLWQMGDAPAASRYWCLTSRDDDRSRIAEAAFKERHGNRAIAMLFDLPVKRP